MEQQTCDTPHDMHARMPGGHVAGPCVKVNRLVRHDLDSPHSTGNSATSFSTGGLHSAPTRPVVHIVQHRPLCICRVLVPYTTDLLDPNGGLQRQTTNVSPCTQPSSSMLQRQHLISCRHVTAANPNHSRATARHTGGMRFRLYPQFPPSHDRLPQLRGQGVSPSTSKTHKPKARSELQATRHAKGAHSSSTRHRPLDVQSSRAHGSHLGELDRSAFGAGHNLQDAI